MTSTHISIPVLGVVDSQSSTHEERHPFSEKDSRRGWNSARKPVLNLIIPLNVRDFASSSMTSGPKHSQNGAKKKKGLLDSGLER